MVAKGFEFMVIGMVVVFIFLALLVLLIRLTHSGLKLFNRYFAEEEKVLTTSIQRVMVKNDDIAVAIAAVKAFMKR